jgi:regulator of protease activity HflC (stomatin/prohibitin superfamily)
MPSKPATHAKPREGAHGEDRMTGFDIFAIALVLLIILTLFAGVKTVPQGYGWTIERFGKFTRTLAPGLNLIIPYFDQVGRKMNMMEQVISIPEQEVITKDNATVTVDGVAFFQVFDAAKASYEVANLEQAIIVLTMTNIRSVMGSMDLDQVLSHRDEINERLLRVVDAAVSPWGLKVNRIEIKDIVPPADLVEAMGRQMKAERVKRADILQAEGQRQSEILRAEGAKQGQILQAEGRREAAFRDAEARERSAEAEARATQMVSDAIAKGDVAALNYFIADKYIKAFGQLAESPNQKVIMLPVEANEHAGLAGRHRRDRESDLWRKRGLRAGRRAPRLGARRAAHAAAVREMNKARHSGARAPGARTRNPENTVCASGFRVRPRRARAPRNDEVSCTSGFRVRAEEARPGMTR